MHDRGHDWALVLAAGEGSRLQETLHRAERVADRRRICTVVAEQHRNWWYPALSDRSPCNVVVQPENRGTAVGILLPLLRIELRDPAARVVLLPSDHFVRDEDTLGIALRGAMRRLERHHREVLLLGHVVPAGAPAEDTLVRGAVWNGFIVAAHLQALLGLFARRFPELVDDLRCAVRHDVAYGSRDAVAEYYEDLPTIDFSRHVLEGQESQLRVMTIPPCGWSDLGAPRRVAAARVSAAVVNLSAQHARLQLAI